MGLRKAIAKPSEKPLTLWIGITTEILIWLSTRGGSHRLRHVLRKQSDAP